MKSLKQQSGFTIVELLIATTIFSGIMIIIVFAIIYISDDFIKGNIQSQTQETARSVMQQISQDIELDNANISYDVHNTSSAGFVCVGNDQYIYNLKQEVNPATNTHALVVQNVSGCSNDINMPVPSIDVLNLPQGATELLGDHMQLGSFYIAPINSGNLYNLEITVAYGDPNGPLKVPGGNGYFPGEGLPLPLPPIQYSCDPSIIHGDFCATVNNLTTVAEQRGN